MRRHYLLLQTVYFKHQFVMKLFYKSLKLPFQYPFTISGGRTKTYQPTLLVALQLGNLIGYGEAPAILTIT